MEKFYLPTNSTSLAHYFGCALIKPSRFFTNKPEDIQDRYSEFLLVTTSFGIKDTDCCLEIVLTEQEQKEELIDAKKGLFFLEKPIPITRIRKIFFTNHDTAENTISNINMSSAFVPNELIEITKDEFDVVKLDDIDTPKERLSRDAISLREEELRRFDRYLGGLALMRLARSPYMNYSDNYFDTLSFFNELIKKYSQRAKGVINESYQGAFTHSKDFAKLMPFLSKNIEEVDLEEIAKEENQEIVKNKTTKIIDIAGLKDDTYIVAVLNMYGTDGESKRKKIDDLILSNFESNIKLDESERIAFCYGFNRGYSVLRSKYKSENSEKIVKYQLNSKLDYYTIESIYQCVLGNEKASYEFSYLDNWCPKNKASLKDKLSLIFHSTNYEVLDVIVIGKKKLSENSPAVSLIKEDKTILGPLVKAINKAVSEMESEKEKVVEDIEPKIMRCVEDYENELRDEYAQQIGELKKQNSELVANKKLLLATIDSLETEKSQKAKTISELQTQIGSADSNATSKADKPEKMLNSETDKAGEALDKSTEATTEESDKSIDTPANAKEQTEDADKKTDKPRDKGAQAADTKQEGEILRDDNAARNAEESFQTKMDLDSYETTTDVVPGKNGESNIGPESIADENL